MSARVRLDQRGDEVVAVKVARPDEVSALEREADLLHRARHPGVVEVFDLERGSDGSASLVTRFAGGHSLATVRLRDPDHVAAVMAAVATTLADLHRLGLVHGRVTADHVLLDQRARPVLCGPTGEGTAADDVSAVGDLLADLLSGDLDGEPIPDRRFGFRERRRAWRGYRRRGLLNLADQARADDPQRRPSARALATAIHELVPDASLPALDDDARHDVDRSARDGDDTLDEPSADTADELRGAAGARLLAMAMLGAALCAAGVASFFDQPTDAPVADAPPACAEAEPTAAPLDIDGDGCPDRVDITSGIVAAAGHRWAVGRPNDELAVGDWNCDGVATPALLRRDTGEVFVFDRWADDHEVRARARSVVPEAATIEAVAIDTDTHAVGCHELRVVGEGGRPLAVVTEPS